MGNYIMFIWNRHSCAKFLISIWQITPWLRLRSQFSEKFPSSPRLRPWQHSHCCSLQLASASRLHLLNEIASFPSFCMGSPLIGTVIYLRSHSKRVCVCVGVRERRREQEESGRSQRRQWQCLCCCAPFRGRLALSFLFSFADAFKLKRDKQTIKINLRA